MSWLSDLIRGEITEEAHEQTQAPASQADVQSALREIIRDELKAAVKEEIAAAKKEQETNLESSQIPEQKQEQAQIDIKSEVKKALAETLNYIPAKERKLEESYERVFNA